MAKKVKKKYNFLWIGVIAGVIAPLITSYLYYLTKNIPGITYQVYIENVLGYGIMSQILSLCLMGNLAVFFIFLKLDRDRTAQGVLLASFIYGMVMLVFKFLV